MATSRPRKLSLRGFWEDVVDGFFIGGVLGSAYHFAIGGINGVCNNVPRTSRFSFFTAAFYGIFEATISARGKEEPVLDIAVAAGGAYGIIDLPKGFRYAGRSALIGAALGGALQAGTMYLQDRDHDVSPQAHKAGDPTRAH
ncbi:unnamed protein product [Alopecurus aequalis]